ncbi:alpha/beta fold hydrolase [Neobacillus thermocopriae]|uniref:Alpha/beta hydrolase n=1 Tax=Neobacillus thermocopriae TaxID=1215031 RepID=A0A6B3TN47_9BACI|nr:alpha/beta hydrolase [Neobacillus thermocopriae]MED3623949.1 alpha/beta hydrolase [Neobacillus thermocopriae]MED3713856.1 alpha/beta hydrolase [Neobacillus thermocopriae]NEX78002.1 alpha/beta hydrolase [Neobacillus thermocopriae]
MSLLNLGESSLYYNVMGEGTPIIFIHPPLLTSANFKYQVEELSKKFKVITFDIRGHGRSTFSNEPINYCLIVNDMKMLLDHLGIRKAYVCGYSTGGSIVLEFLLSQPDRAFGGIIVSGMSEIYDLYNEKRIWLARTLANAGAIGFLALGISWGNANTKEIFTNMYQEARKGNAKNIAQYYNYSLKYNCTNQLHTIHHPVLLVYGKKDKAFHKYARILQEKLPSNELKFIKEKHQIPTKSAGELNRLITEFIENQQ